MAMTMYASIPDAAVLSRENCDFQAVNMCYRYGLNGRGSGSFILSLFNHRALFSSVQLFCLVSAATVLGFIFESLVYVPWIWALKKTSLL